MRTALIAAPPAIATLDSLIVATPTFRHQIICVNPDALDEVVSRPEPGVVIVGTDILFEPALGYRPYEALRRLGRRGPMVATWLGVVEDQDVVRSSPGHPEYCRVRLDVPFLQADAKGGVS